MPKKERSNNMPSRMKESMSTTKVSDNVKDRVGVLLNYIENEYYKKTNKKPGLIFNDGIEILLKLIPFDFKQLKFTQNVDIVKTIDSLL